MFIKRNICARAISYLKYGTYFYRPISNLLDSFDFVSIEAEVFCELARFKEVFDLLSAKVFRHRLKLVFCDFNIDLLSDFDAALGLLEHCLILSLLVEDMIQ